MTDRLRDPEKRQLRLEELRIELDGLTLKGRLHADHVSDADATLTAAAVQLCAAEMIVEAIDRLTDTGAATSKAKDE